MTGKRVYGSALREFYSQEMGALSFTTSSVLTALAVRAVLTVLETSSSCLLLVVDRNNYMIRCQT